MHITMYTKNIAKSETIVFEKGMIRSYVSGIYTTDKSREIRLYSVLLQLKNIYDVYSVNK